MRDTATQRRRDSICMRDTATQKGEIGNAHDTRPLFVLNTQ